MKNNGNAPRHSGTVAGSDSSINHDPVSLVDAVRCIPDGLVFLYESETHNYNGYGRETGEGFGLGIEARQEGGQRTVKNGEYCTIE
jgi:hypothetical protein